MYLDSFTRQRAGRKPAPNNPDREVDDWSIPDELPIEGYWEMGSSDEQVDATRKQALTTRTLVIFNPDIDVRRGDRIKQGEKVWTVQGFPDAPRNPFTGRRPGLWVRLLEGVG